MRIVRIMMIMLLCGGIAIAAVAMISERPVALRAELSLSPDSVLDFGQIGLGERNSSAR